MLVFPFLTRIEGPELQFQHLIFANNHTDPIKAISINNYINININKENKTFLSINQLSRCVGATPLTEFSEK